MLSVLLQLLLLQTALLYQRIYLLIKFNGRPILLPLLLVLRRVSFPLSRPIRSLLIILLRRHLLRNMRIKVLQDLPDSIGALLPGSVSSLAPGLRLNAISYNSTLVQGCSSCCLSSSPVLREVRRLRSRRTGGLSLRLWGSLSLSWGICGTLRQHPSILNDLWPSLSWRGSVMGALLLLTLLVLRGGIGLLVRLSIHF